MAQERHNAEELASIGRRQATGLVDDEGVAEARQLVALHCLEEAKGVRVGEDAMLLETLAIVAALHVVEAARVAAVVPGVDAAPVIDLDAEGVAASLGEDLETTLLGMIAPDVLA